MPECNVCVHRTNCQSDPLVCSEFSEDTQTVVSQEIASFVLSLSPEHFRRVVVRWETEQHLRIYISVEGVPLFTFSPSNISAAVAHILADHNVDISETVFTVEFEVWGATK